MGGGAMTAGKMRPRFRVLKDFNHIRHLRTWLKNPWYPINLIAFFLLLEDVTKCPISVASLRFRERERGACTRCILAISRVPATMLVSLNGCFCLRIGQTSGSIPYLVLL